MAGAKRQSARRRSSVEWQAVLQELAESGEGVDLFCRRQGIRPPTLRWWRWRLKGRRVAPKPDRRVVTPPHPKFTELQVLPAPVRPEASVACFELRWRDGLTLVVPQGFDRDALCRLLAVLEVAGC